MVHGIVQSYQGRISVYSARGKGTSVHVYLPRLNGQSLLDETVLTAPLPTSKEHILVIDNQESITDMTMPHLTGLELARKALAIRPDLPITLCTGFSELIDKDQVRSIGIWSYLMKPVSVREMALTVWQVLTKDEKTS